MNYFKILLGLILFLSLNASAQNKKVVEKSTQNKVVGKLGLVRGEVQVDGKEVKSGATVREGNSIEVHTGQATLLLGQGSVIHLAADSKMIVHQFGVSPLGVETGDLDLKFGRTRALILNKSGDKKDIRIKARAATMGVRGTEVFISAPKESAEPVQFFTLEGKAEVQAPNQAAPVTVNQGEGVAASGGGGGAQGGNAGTTATSSGTSGSQGGGSTSLVAAPPAQVAQVRSEIQTGGMAPPPVRSFQDAMATSGQAPQQQPPPNPGGFLSDQGIVLRPVLLDPTVDALRQVTVLRPTFCAGSAASCP